MSIKDTMSSPRGNTQAMASWAGVLFFDWSLQQADRFEVFPQVFALKA
jgi:hypothetical protein